MHTAPLQYLDQNVFLTLKKRKERWKEEARQAFTTPHQYPLTLPLWAIKTMGELRERINLVGKEDLVLVMIQGTQIYCLFHPYFPDIITEKILEKE